MILKQPQGQPVHDASSYRPISLLPVLDRLIEKVSLNKMRLYLPEVIPFHQFGLREQHRTIEQIHRMLHSIHGYYKSC